LRAEGETRCDSTRASTAFTAASTCTRITGEIVLERNLATTPEAFLEAIAPYREGLVVACECLFTWYWLADLCAKEQIP
jgi:hypothetical protein